MLATIHRITSPSDLVYHRLPPVEGRSVHMSSMPSTYGSDQSNHILNIPDYSERFSTMRLRSSTWKLYFFCFVNLSVYYDIVSAEPGSPMLRLSYLQDSPMAQSNSDSWITEDTVANVTSLSCTDFDSSCEWESITSHNVLLKWFRSSGYLDPAYFGPITNTSTIPTGYYAVAAHDSASDPNISAVLTSASAVCPGGLQEFSFSYWLSPGVVLKLCIMLSVKSYPNFDFCRIMDRSLSPGPVTITTPSLGDNSFQIFLIATNFTFVSDKFVGGFAVIDNITFTDDSCVMTTPAVGVNTTEAPSIQVDGATRGAVLTSGGTTVASAGATGATVIAHDPVLNTTGSGVTGAPAEGGTTVPSGGLGSVTGAGSVAGESVGTTTVHAVSSNDSAVTGASHASEASGAAVTGPPASVTAPAGGSGLLTSSPSLDTAVSTTSTNTSHAESGTEAPTTPGAPVFTLPAWASLMPPIGGVVAAAVNATGLPAIAIDLNSTGLPAIASVLNSTALPSIDTALNATGSVLGTALNVTGNAIATALNSTGLPSIPIDLNVTGLPTVIATALNSTALPAIDMDLNTTGIPAAFASMLPLDPSAVTVPSITDLLPTIPTVLASIAADPGTVVQHDSVDNNPMLATGLPASLANLTAALEPHGGSALDSNTTVGTASDVPATNAVLPSESPSNTSNDASAVTANPPVLPESVEPTPMDPARILLSTIPVDQLPYPKADPGTVIQHDAVGGNPMLATALPANLSSLLEPVGGVALISNTTNSTLMPIIPVLSASSAAPGLALPAVGSVPSEASSPAGNPASLEPTTVGTTLPPTTLDANATAAAAAAKAALLDVCETFTCDFEPNSKYSCALPLNYTRWSSTTSIISSVNGTSIAPPTGSAMAYIKGPMPWSRLLLGSANLPYATNFYYQYKVSLNAGSRAVFDVYLKRSDFFIETLMANPIMTTQANPATWNNVTELIFPGAIEYIAFEVRNLAADEVVAVSATGLQPVFGNDYCSPS
uniref:MAM domain-containing protein n=1 Tax=Panagrellus redivivus TaxID=6233 RepID=A0A7E4UTR4_PANRE